MVRRKVLLLKVNVCLGSRVVALGLDSLEAGRSEERLSSLEPKVDLGDHLTYCYPGENPARNS